MIKFKRNLLALAVSLAVSAGALADGTSKDDYKAGSELIEARYDVDKAGCAPLAGNAQDICLAEAKRRQRSGPLPERGESGRWPVVRRTGGAAANQTLPIHC